MAFGEGLICQWVCLGYHLLKHTSGWGEVGEVGCVASSASIMPRKKLFRTPEVLVGGYRAVGWKWFFRGLWFEMPSVSA